MKYQTIEIRSEEEFIGNVLWLISKEENDSETALRNLWIEAQEYGPMYSNDEKNSEYKREEKGFLYENMAVDDFEKTVKAYIEKVYSCYSSELFKATIDNIETRERISFPNIAPDSIVQIIEKDFTEFSAFVTEPTSFMYFCWTDVS